MHNSMILKNFACQRILSSTFSIETWTVCIVTHENLDRKDCVFYTLELFASDGQLYEVMQMHLCMSQWKTLLIVHHSLLFG